MFFSQEHGKLSKTSFYELIFKAVVRILLRAIKRQSSVLLSQDIPHCFSCTDRLPFHVPMCWTSEQQVDVYADGALLRSGVCMLTQCFKMRFPLKNFNFYISFLYTIIYVSQLHKNLIRQKKKHRSIHFYFYYQFYRYSIQKYPIFNISHPFSWQTV